MKKVLSILVGLFVLYLIVSFAWSILNAQQCSILAEKNATCEQIAENNSKSCKYVVLQWKKVDYDKELQQCKEWEQKQTNKTNN
ncbi:MAG: hypothetical protein V1808_01440 [Candidatus Daviesbacteria bacterium]